MCYVHVVVFDVDWVLSLHAIVGDSSKVLPRYILPPSLVGFGLAAVISVL